MGQESGNTLVGAQADKAGAGIRGPESLPLSPYSLKASLDHLHMVSNGFLTAE